MMYRICGWTRWRMAYGMRKWQMRMFDAIFEIIVKAFSLNICTFETRICIYHGFAFSFAVEVF